MLVRLGAAVLAAVFLLPAAPAAAAPPASPARFDVAAAEKALGTRAVYRAPGAVAVFDEGRVLPLLGTSTKLVLVPPRPFGRDDDSYETTYRPLNEWATGRDLDVLLVTGVNVQILGRGTVSEDDLGALRVRFAQRDVTDPLVFATRVIADPDYEDTRAPGLVTVPAEAGLVAEVTAGLRASPRYVAPGVQAELGDGSRWPTLVPGLGVRVAALPILPLGSRYPDLLTPLSRAFPGELVVIVRGSWIEAVGPDQPEVDSARNYVLGRAQDRLAEQNIPAANVVGLMLDRLGQLRSGEPFGRPQVDGLDVGELWDRYAVPLAVVIALLLGGGSLLWWGTPTLERGRQTRQQFRVQRAQVFARLSAVSAAVVSTSPGGTVVSASPGGGDRDLARAAERHSAAIGLLEQADATNDLEVLAAAAEAVEQASSELRRAGVRS